MRNRVIVTAATTGPPLPPTPEPGIEHAALYPQTLDADCDEWDLRTSRDPDEAAGLVRFVNKRLTAAGAEPRAVVLERTITFGDWRVAPTAGAAGGEEDPA